MISKEFCSSYFAILATFSVALCLLPMFIGCDRTFGSNISIAVNSLAFEYSLVSLFSMAIPLLAHILLNMVSYKSIKGMMAFNILMILTTVTPSGIIFFYAISANQFKLIVCMIYIRLLTIMCVALTFISNYGCAVYCNHCILLSGTCLVIGCVLRVYPTITPDSVGATLETMGLVLQAAATIIFAGLSIRWYRYCKRQVSKEHSLDSYSCSVYVFSVWVYAIGLWSFKLIFPSKAWNDFNVNFMTAHTYIIAAFIVILLVYQERAARIESAISKVREELELKKVLVRFISHEIRTPINTLSMGLEHLDEQLAARAISPGEISGIIVDLRFACNQSQNFLDQLLAYDKLETGVLKLDKSSFPVLPLMDQVIQEFSLQARVGSVNLAVEVSDSCADILRRSNLHADRSKVILVMRNVISNALKFTKAAPSQTKTVRVVVDIQNAEASSTAQHQELLRVRVIDNGVGIAKENLPRLFQEGVQFNPEKLQAGGGSGLGLWICSRVVDLHGGLLTATSDGEGCGCTFTLLLGSLETEASGSGSDIAGTTPEGNGGSGAAAAEGDVEAPAVDVNGGVYVSFRQRHNSVPSSARRVWVSNSDSRIHAEVNFVEENVVTHFDVSSVNERAPFIAKSALVVDDTALNRKFVCKLLQSGVESLVEAEDGLEAVQKIKASMERGAPFDVIFMDFVMPNMDGPTATREIRTLGYTGVILGVTGNVTEEDIALFKLHGVNEVLPKPVTKALLMERLQFFMSER